MNLFSFFISATALQLHAHLYDLCNPFSPSVKIQNLLTGIHTFSYGTNWENLLKIITVSIQGDHALDSHYPLS